MRIGHNRKLWVKNCVAIGLAGGFIEPLESTGIALVSQGLALLSFHFPTRDCPEPLADSYNSGMTRLYEHIREFIVLHYCTTQREDTEFWRANKHNPNVPERLKSHARNLALSSHRTRSTTSADSISFITLPSSTSWPACVTCRSRPITCATACREAVSSSSARGSSRCTRAPSRQASIMSSS